MNQQVTLHYCLYDEITGYIHNTVVKKISIFGIVTCLMSEINNKSSFLQNSFKITNNSTINNN